MRVVERASARSRPAPSSARTPSRLRREDHRARARGRPPGSDSSVRPDVAVAHVHAAGASPGDEALVALRDALSHDGRRVRLEPCIRVSRGARRRSAAGRTCHVDTTPRRVADDERAVADQEAQHGDRGAPPAVTASASLSRAADRAGRSAATCPREVPTKRSSPRPSSASAVTSPPRRRCGACGATPRAAARRSAPSLDDRLHDQLAGADLRHGHRPRSAARRPPAAGSGRLLVRVERDGRPSNGVCGARVRGRP